MDEMADHRQQLARLSIAPPFHGQVPLYSPALQTAVHHTFPPLTLLGHGQFGPAPFPGPQFPQFRNRCQPSVSVGGPPKAQPGGVGKNYRPPSPTANATPPSQKPNNAIVNLPKHSVSAGDGRPLQGLPSPVLQSDHILFRHTDG